MKTIIEPFRIKTVEPINFTDRQQRQQILAKAGYNLFRIKAREVIIDLLTDSGTSAMSSEQWAAIMRGDESYAGCESFYRLQEKVRQIFGFRELIPVHQGRAAERLMFTRLVKEGDLVPSNTHFDTTRANIEVRGACAVDLPCQEASDLQSAYPFKGNIDLEAVEKFLQEHGKERIPLGMLVVSNNACAGQPASLANISAYSRLLKEHNIKFYLDAARFAENCYMIKEHEPGQAGRPVRAIAADIFRQADGCLMSAKKDGLVNMGGFIAINDGALAEELRQSLILTEGFPTYGGLSGRDLEAMAVGLEEVLSENYLRYRRAAADYLARGLQAHDIPIVTPAGLHAVYIDATAMLPHLKAGELPGQALACALYLEGGIRACEIGRVMFGEAALSPDGGTARHDLVRLALPRRVYSQSHYDYVIEAAANVYKRREQVAGLRITEQPAALRHFTARFEPLPVAPSAGVPRTVSASPSP